MRRPPPIVSIIVPVYNAERYLEQTIQSVLNQTFPDFEIVCINDGSTDNSLDLLERLSSRDSRIAIYTQRNMGQSVARNVGIMKARGQYVYFLDSDDLLDKTLIEKAIGKIREHDLEMVLFDATTIYDDNLESSFEEFSNYYERRSRYEGVKTGITLMREMIDGSDYRVAPYLYMVRRDIISKNNLRFIPGIIHEDNAFTFEVMNCVKRAEYIKERLYIRRIHDGSTMTSNKSFNNTYGYFVCANKLLWHDYKTIDPEDDPSDLATQLAYIMLKLAQRDLLSSPIGEEGAAYAMDDDALRMFKILVLDAVEEQRLLDEKNGECDRLENRIRENHV